MYSFWEKLRGIAWKSEFNHNFENFVGINNDYKSSLKSMFQYLHHALWGGKSRWDKTQQIIILVGMNLRGFDIPPTRDWSVTWVHTPIFLAHLQEKKYPGTKIEIKFKKNRFFSYCDTIKKHLFFLFY